MSNVAKELLQLRDEWEVLADKENEESEAFQHWYHETLFAIKSIYGDRSKESDSFIFASKPKGSVKIIRMLIAQEKDKSSQIAPHMLLNVNQYQATSVHQELKLDILLKIEHSSLSDEEKEEAKKLYQDVSEEVTQEKPNWQKVTDLLKKSFNYGLKIAPDLVRLADSYYKAKGA